MTWFVIVIISALLILSTIPLEIKWLAIVSFLLILLRFTPTKIELKSDSVVIRKLIFSDQVISWSKINSLSINKPHSPELNIQYAIRYNKSKPRKIVFGYGNQEKAVSFIAKFIENGIQIKTDGKPLEVKLFELAKEKLKTTTNKK